MAEQNEEQGVLVQSVTVPGATLEIRNRTGKIWAIPAEEVVDSYAPHRSAFDVKRFPGYNPDFEYEFHGPGVADDHDDIPEMLNDDWVPVTREELGVSKIAPGPQDSQYGMTQSTNHAVGKQVCMMKPKVLVERQRAAYKRYADAVVGQVAPTSNSSKLKMEREGSLVVDEVKSSTTFKEPSAA